MSHAPSRRIVLGAGLFAAGSWLGTDRALAQTLPATPACHRGEELTLRQTEGPFFKPSSPERTEFVEPGMAGQRLELTGFVLSPNCKPLAGAVLDFWHADDSGQYDNSGFRLRGHQFADAEGRYTLRSIVPGLYVGRTRHIHVKVQPPGGALLTTQLYFPGEPRNRSDGLFRKELLVRTTEGPALLSARFDFVLT
jgi:protocatechuate 3,4-dioxygenase beta subunit